jgi:hypothetical protein
MLNIGFDILLDNMEWNEIREKAGEINSRKAYTTNDKT